MRGGKGNPYLPKTISRTMRKHHTRTHTHTHTHRQADKTDRRHKTDTPDMTDVTDKDRTGTH